jgi:hypothetical protein
MKRCTRAFVVASCLLLLAGRGEAGSLQLFEASAGAGSTLVIGGPVSNSALDIDYDASSAEGGELFGFSVLLLQTTGDVVFTSSVVCQAAGCIFNPDVSNPTTQIRFSGGNPAGETGIQNLATIGITGSFGTVEVVGGSGGGQYFAPLISQQEFSPFVLATVVPEPSTALLLGGALALLPATARWRRDP